MNKMPEQENLASAEVVWWFGICIEKSYCPTSVSEEVFWIVWGNSLLNFPQHSKKHNLIVYLFMHIAASAILCFTGK